MKHFKILFLFAVLSTQLLFAFELDVASWNDFRGKLNGKDVSMSLFRFSNNQVRGHYYYIGTETKIYLVGKIDKTDIRLWSIVDKHAQLALHGKFFSDTMDRFEGTCTEKDGRKLTFKLNLEAKTGGSYENRYSDLNSTTAEVEEFAKQVKLAILLGNKKWLSMHVSFPIKINISSKKRITIKNQKQFIANFDRIFHSAYLEKAKTFEYFNMFSNYQGVMLGNGDIWINTVNAPDQKQSYLRIIAINN